MSNSRKSAGKTTGLLSGANSSSGTGASTSTGGGSHQHHKNLRRHLDMGIPSYGGVGDNTNNNNGSQANNQANLFEIKKAIY